jgi:uncharacterized protein (DUF427 family)
MTSPEPARHIVITPHKGRVSVRFGDTVVATSTHALDLREGSYPVVVYVPRDDVDETALARTSHTTHCPNKGDANYFSVVDGDRTVENAAWTYETPLPGVSAIKNALAFYPNKVSLEFE